MSTFPPSIMLKSMLSTPTPAPEEAKQSTFVTIMKAAWGAAIGGSIHAVIEQPIVTPIEASITQTQINGKRFTHNFMDLYRQRALYRALPTALVGAVPKAVVHYSILTTFSVLILPGGMGDLAKSSPVQATLVGAAVGASEVMLTTPLNLVKFRMQRPEWGYKGMVDAVKTIAKTEGIPAFWLGAQYIVLRNTICNAGMVGGLRKIEGVLEEHASDIHPEARHLMSGAGGGLIGSFLSYPFEMLRAARMHRVSFYEQMFKPGFKRLMAGWIPGATRLVVTSAIMGSIIPRLKGFRWGEKKSEPVDKPSGK